MHRVEASFDSLAARYVRVRARYLGENPSWHPAAGRPAWLFVDEIIVN